MQNNVLLSRFNLTIEQYEQHSINNNYTGNLIHVATSLSRFESFVRFNVLCFSSPISQQYLLYCVVVYTDRKFCTLYTIAVHFSKH